MNAENSTGNPARLPLAERARQGLLGNELELYEIMELEFPTYTSYEDRQQPEYKSWHKAIETAIRFGFLVPREDKTTIVVPQIVSTRMFYRGALDGASPPILQRGGSYISTRYWIDHKSYQTWRISQSNKPAGSFIYLWLGATPTAESIPPVETSLPESESVAQGGAARRESAVDNGIALVVAENAALLALRKELKREPTAHQWLKYWKEGKDTEGTIQEVTENLVL